MGAQLTGEERLMLREESWSVPRKAVLVLLLGLLSCAVVVPQAMAVTVTYDIQAYIDFHDVLIIRSDTLQWHHMDGAAVGRWEGLNEPTIISTAINGNPQLVDSPWIPDWRPPTSATTPFPPSSRAWSPDCGQLRRPSR
jgi:hypothetical protein